MEEKRLFVGGLTPKINEKDLENIFSRFGEINNIELKSKYDTVQDQTKVFAFIEIKIKPNDLASCFRAYANKKWKDCTLNLQVARESILARLKRERDARQWNKRVSSESTSNLVNDQTKVNPVLPPTFSVLKLIKKSHKKADSSSSNPDDDDDDEPSNPLEIPLFHGIRYHKVNATSNLTQKNVQALAQKDVDEEGSGSSSSSADTDEIIRRRKSKKLLSSKNNLSEQKISSVQQKLLNLGGVSTAHSLPSVVSKSRENVQNILTSPLDNKIAKHEISNRKRLASMKLRQNQSKSQKLVIKSALSQIDNNEARNNKIKFHYDNSNDDGIQSDTENNVAPNTAPSEETSKRVADTLFDSDNDEDQDADNDFRIRPQYEGRKGQKLIALQHTFGNDDRFKMDEKFIESENSGDEDDYNSQMGLNSTNEVNEEENFVEEKQRNIDILQSVLGWELDEPPPEKITKSLFRDTREIRYDPTDPNSSRLEVQSKEPIKKTKKKKVVDVQGEVVMPEVSSEKYYEVSENLKDRFTNTNKADSQTAVFSLLSMFDGNSGRAAETKNDDTYSYEVIKNKNTDSPVSNQEKSSPLKKTGSAWKSSNVMKGFFFFQKNDERLTRGTAFFVRTQDLNELRNKWSTERRTFLDVFHAKKKQSKRKSRGKPQKQSAKRGRYRK